MCICIYNHQRSEVPFATGNISNGLTIGSNFDLMSEGLLDYAKETPGHLIHLFFCLEKLLKWDRNMRFNHEKHGDLIKKTKIDEIYDGFQP